MKLSQGINKEYEETKNRIFTQIVGEAPSSAFTEHKKEGITMENTENKTNRAKVRSKKAGLAAIAACAVIAVGAAAGSGIFNGGVTPGSQETESSASLHAEDNANAAIDNSTLIAGVTVMSKWYVVDTDRGLMEPDVYEQESDGTLAIKGVYTAYRVLVESDCIFKQEGSEADVEELYFLQPGGSADIKYENGEYSYDSGIAELEVGDKAIVLLNGKDKMYEDYFITTDGRYSLYKLNADTGMYENLQSASGESEVYDFIFKQLSDGTWDNAAAIFNNLGLVSSARGEYSDSVEPDYIINMSEDRGVIIINYSLGGITEAFGEFGRLADEAELIGEFIVDEAIPQNDMVTQYVLHRTFDHFEVSPFPLDGFMYNDECVLELENPVLSVGDNILYLLDVDMLSEDDVNAGKYVYIFDNDNGLPVYDESRSMFKNTDREFSISAFEWIRNSILNKGADGVEIWYALHGTKVVDLAGRTRAEAEEILNGVGMKYEIREMYSDEVETGFVIKTDWNDDESTYVVYISRGALTAEQTPTADFESNWDKMEEFKTKFELSKNDPLFGCQGTVKALDGQVGEMASPFNGMQMKILGLGYHYDLENGEKANEVYSVYVYNKWDYSDLRLEEEDPPLDYYYDFNLSTDKSEMKVKTFEQHSVVDNSQKYALTRIDIYVDPEFGFDVNDIYELQIVKVIGWSTENGDFDILQDGVFNASLDFSNL